MSKYKSWRSARDKALHVVCAEGKEAFEALPAAIRGLGPWTGSREGEINKLRLHYRLTLLEQGFTLVHAPAANFEPEMVSRISVDNTSCPDCGGDGEVDQHGGLRKKTCWRCGGRGWVRGPTK